MHFSPGVLRAGQHHPLPCTSQQHLDQAPSRDLGVLGCGTIICLALVYYPHCRHHWHTGASFIYRGSWQEGGCSSAHDFQAENRLSPSVLASWAALDFLGKFCEPWVASTHLCFGVHITPTGEQADPWSYVV
jgi:hypothetical protein